MQLEREKIGLGQTLRNTVRFIVWDWSTLLLFELLYKLALLFFSPLTQDIFYYAMDSAGITFFSNQSIGRLLQSPAAIVSLLAVCLMVVFAAGIEVAAVLTYFESAGKGEEIRIGRLFIQAVKRVSALFRWKKIGILPFLFFLLPLIGFSISSGPFQRLRIPGFVLDSLRRNAAAGAAVGILFAAVLGFIFYHIFSIPETVLEDGSFRDAMRRSRLLLEGRKARTLGCFLVWLALSFSVAILFFVAAILILFLWANIFYDGEQALYAFWFSWSRLRDGGGVLASIYFTVCNLGILTALYRQYHGGRPSCVKPIFTANESRWRRGAAFLSRFFILFFILLLYVESSVLSVRPWRSQSEAEIVAHRAGAAFAPENTLAALREAERSGAAFAEIDIQQTKDGALVAMHDVSLQRTAGIRKRVSEATLEEIRGLEAGSYFAGAYSGEKIPTLEEMIRAARGRIRLMIEIKNSHGQEGVAKAVVSQLQNEGALKECVIASMDYEILEQVKGIAPDIRTVYIMAAAYGEPESLKAADMLSVEESFITPGLISLSHQWGKPVYAWTVNSEKSMRGLLSMGVDGIVTDNPYLAGYVLETDGRGMLLNTLLGGLLPPRGSG